MDILSAFIMGELHRYCEPKVFDWDKAAQIIRDTRPTRAVAGLRGDWNCTAGTIYEDGKPVKNEYTFLESTWATPELKVDDKYVECFKMASEAPDWDCHTKWPPSALAILEGKA